MPAQMQSVLSSRVSQIGWDPDNGDLVVVWQRGKTSVYKDVPEQVANQVINSPSVGSAINELIEGQYEHGYP